MTIPAEIKATPHSTAIRQIHAAIEMLWRGDFECAIVLAHAAEGILPDADKPHTFQKIKTMAAALPTTETDANVANRPNDFVNWLKHGNGPDGKKIEGATIADHEAIGMITRAISKFAAVYQQISPEMERFADAAKKHLSN